MTVLHVERLGGLPGVGNPRSRLRSCGEISLSDLSQADRAAVEELFRNPPRAAPVLRDAFRYRISRDGSSGGESVEGAERGLATRVAADVKDTFICERDARPRWRSVQ